MCVFSDVCQLALQSLIPLSKDLKTSLFTSGKLAIIVSIFVPCHCTMWNPLADGTHCEVNL